MSRLGSTARLAAFVCLPLLACSRAPGISARAAADANDTGGTLAAKSASEQAILREVPTLPIAVQRQVGGVAIVADAPYASASGRTCRVLHIAADAPAHDPDRLACSNGSAWFFVPDVFADVTMGSGLK